MGVTQRHKDGAFRRTMHLLAAQPGTIEDGSEAVDLGQTPGDIVFLSAADTEIASLARAQREQGKDAPTLRLANLLRLGHNLSVDLYIDSVVGEAKLVIARLLGGRGYWPYGVEQLVACCRARAIPLALLPGDDQPDAELAGLSSPPAAALHRLRQYCVQGGIANAGELLRYAATLIGRDTAWSEPAPLLRAGLYWPGLAQPALADLPWWGGDFPRTSRRAFGPPQHEENLEYPHPEEAQSAVSKGPADLHQPGSRPVAAIVFYRALVQAGNMAAVDALIEALAAQGLNALPIYAASLRDPVAGATIAELLAQAPPAVILNATGFACSTPGETRGETPFDAADCAVLQVVFSGGGEAAWREGTRGLSARDIAMNVALPEIDGRILSRAVSFKGNVRRDQATQADVVEYSPVADRVDFTARLAAGWARLREKPFRMPGWFPISAN